MFPPAIPFSVSVKTLNLQLGQVVSIDSLDRISGKISVQKIELDAMFVLLMFNSDKHFEFYLLNFIYVLRSFSFCLDFPSCNLTEKVLNSVSCASERENRVMFDE